MSYTDDSKQTQKVLTIIIEHEKCYINSREVAKMVGKSHSDLVKNIKRYLRVLSSGEFKADDYFVKSAYIGRNMQKNVCYLCTKKGCDMIANKLISDKGILFTATYIELFYQKEKEIKERKSILPQFKVERKHMNDAINELPNSPHKRWKFKQYTNLVYKAVTGHDAKRLKESRMSKKTSDCLSATELKLMTELEIKIAVLIESGLGFHQIKEIVFNNLKQKVLKSV